MPGMPTQQQFDLACWAAEVTRPAELAGAELQRHGIQLLAARSLVVFESRF